MQKFCTIIWVSGQNSSRKKICARLREYMRVLREYAPVLRVLRGPGNCENQKSEQTKTVSAQDCQLLLFNHKQHASLRREEKGVVGSEPGILLLIGLQSCGQLACEGFYPVLQPIPSPRQCGCGLRGVGSRLQERPPVARYEGEA